MTSTKPKRAVTVSEGLVELGLSQMSPLFLTILFTPILHHSRGSPQPMGLPGCRQEKQEQK